MWENQTWMLQNDNEADHMSLLICSYLAKYQTSVVPHPPYSLDLASAANNGRNVGNGVSPVERTTLKVTVLKVL